MSKSLVGQQIKSYNVVKKLGEGAFAIVYQGLDQNTQQIVAIKVIKLSELKRTQKLAQLVKTQINVLKQCHNINVIHFIDSFETNQHLIIITQYCNGGDLQEYIQKKGKLTQQQAVVFLKQILNGFKGLHQIGAMHRDFKVANVLLDNGICKIADLGFAKQMQQRSVAKTILGTSVTMAPEILQQRPYGFQADIWSIGVVFYQLIYGNYPYYAKSDYEMLLKIKNNRPNYFGINISQQAKDFIQKCLTVDPKKRLSWKQIYLHPLINKQKDNWVNVGRLKPQLSMNQNLKFYQTNKLPQKNPIIQQIESAKKIKLQVISEKDIRATQNFQKIKQQTDKCVQKQNTYQRIQNLYLGRINDLMFTQKYIQPHISMINQIRVNHQTALFILNKKAYMEMKKLYQSIQNNKNIFNINDYFYQYTKSIEYKQILSQAKNHLTNLKNRCEQYKKNIKLSTLQIQKQLDMNYLNNPNYDVLMKQVAKQYIKTLAQNLDCVKIQNKTQIIKTIQALMYLKQCPKPYSHQFERIYLSTDLNKAQKDLRSRYPSKLIIKD